VNSSTFLFAESVHRDTRIGWNSVGSSGGVGVTRVTVSGIAAVASAIGKGGFAVDGTGGIGTVSGIILLCFFAAIFLPHMVMFLVLALLFGRAGDYFDGFHRDKVIAITAIAAAVAAAAERSGSNQCQS
jgi:hypothetical protein